MQRKFLLLTLVLIVLAGCSKKSIPDKSVSKKNQTTKSVAIIPESLKLGSRLYATKCGNCHGLKRTDEFTSAAWLPIMDRMAVEARLSESEKASILAYVQAYSKK
jgi:mono/diheme cytochrome c family protein